MRINNLVRGGSAILLSLVAMALSTFTPMARDGPLIPTDTATASPTVTATGTSTPAPTRTPSPTPTFTPTRTPTPTDAVIEISTRYKIERSLLYLPSILQLNEYDLDPLLVVSVIAAETGGDYTIVSYAGACGPMQVIPKPWFPYSAEAICESTWANLIMGMRILRGAIDLAEGDLRYGLAYYNCSIESVHNDRCGERGGLHYADDVLDFLYPRVVQAFSELED